MLGVREEMLRGDKMSWVLNIVVVTLPSAPAKIHIAVCQEGVNFTLLHLISEHH